MDIKSYIKKSIEVKKNILDSSKLMNKVSEVVMLFEESLRNGNKLIFAGNGGSAADSQHLAAEFVSRFMFNRPSLASIALTTDSSILTSIGNDYGFEYLFSRQLESLAKKGDVFIGISTSGNSENIIKALEICREKQITSVGLTGKKKCKMDSLCDYNIKVPSELTNFIQESHIMLGHYICMKVEQNIFSDN